MCYETVNNIKLVKLCISRYNESKAVTLMSYSHFILRNKSKTKQKTESLIHLTYILQSNLQKWHKSCHSVLGRVDIYIPFKRTLRGIIAKRYKTQQTKTNKKKNWWEKEQWKKSLFWGFSFLFLLSNICREKKKRERQRERILFRTYFMYVSCYSYSISYQDSFKWC